MTVPEVPISSSLVDLGAGEKQVNHEIIQVCKEVVPGWRDIRDKEVSVSKISGGITNILMRVTPVGKQAGKEPVTVRIFGPNTEVVIDRKREWEAIRLLSAAGFGAKLIGAFKNGVVQSFIYARTLEPKDMSGVVMSARIAESVRRFHAVNVPGTRDPQLWPTINRFLELARHLSFEEERRQERFDTIDFREVEREVEEVESASSTLHAPVVFSHNDLLSGNFMIDDQSGRFYIIDFEYGAYGYRGYDLGNHFNEYAGFDCDYSLYPTKEHQFHFFRHYLRPDAPEQVPVEELEALYMESNCYALASHLYWAVWALVQAKYSPIDFDYLGYFFLRYNEYKRRKADFLPLGKQTLAKELGNKVCV